MPTKLPKVGDKVSLAATVKRLEPREGSSTRVTVELGGTRLTFDSWPGKEPDEGDEVTLAATVSRITPGAGGDETYARISVHVEGYTKAVVTVSRGYLLQAR